MQTKKCKYCNKDIHIKAEICPNCGCRVKSNTLKFIIICVSVIIVLLGAFYGINKLSHIIKENQRINKEKKVLEKELPLFESFLGTYKISYNEEIFNRDFKNFSTYDEFSVNKKCSYDFNEITPNEDDIVEDCLCSVDFDAIKAFCTGNSSVKKVYKLDDNNGILNFNVSNIIVMNDNNYYDEVFFKNICFKKNGDNTFIQTECVKRKNGYSSDDDKEYLDSKYEFKLTKVR